MKTIALLLIFTVILTSAYGWYMQPNLSGSGSGDHSQVYKALSDFFSKLSDDAAKVASASPPGRR
jgi:hypothetical protein